MERDDAMIRLATIISLSVLLVIPAHGSGPVFQHKDRIVNQEFENAYQDIRSKASASEMDAVELTLSTVVSGTYTPTLTNAANIDTSTSYEAQYIRVGNIVTVSGNVEIDATNDNTQTTLGISLPFSSDIGLVGDLAGTAYCDVVAGMGSAVFGDVTNNRASLSYVTTETVNEDFFYTFTYQIN